MAEIKLIDKVRQFLAPIQGRDVDLKGLRQELKIDPNSPAWEGLRVILYRLCEGEHPVLRPTGKRDGSYHVITQVSPIQVFGLDRERRPPYVLIFPKDRDTGLEMFFAESVVVREGDLILIAGRSNFGKTTLTMNMLGENIDKNPVLMGNEFTVIGEKEQWIPAPRFLTRLDNMNWVQWCNGDGREKFELLPVRDDYASHIQRDRINIIDWINIDTGEHYMIGSILEQIKRRLGRGIAIIAIQKAAGAETGRGGQFTQDFADCELLLDALGKDEILLTMGKVKESKGRLYGKTYGYSLWNGVEIRNFREVVACPVCKGSGYVKGMKCDNCFGQKYIDKKGDL
jgi:hypothetical protein